MNTNKRTQTIVGLGLLTAIVIVLQELAVMIRPTGIFSISLVLVPIVIGAALYGWKAGAWLGFVFGLIVMISGDANAFMVVNAPGTIITVLVKGTCAGLVAGLVYRAIAKKNHYLAVVAAAVACPCVNTGIFLIGCYLFFMDTIQTWAGDTNVLTFMIVGLVGVNFLIEMAVNIVLSSVIVQIVKISKKTA